MKQPSAAVNYDRVAHLQTIPDYKAGMVLPDEITVLYTRLSKDDRDKEKKDESNSIVNQKKLLGKHAVEDRLPNPVFFTDDGISGTTFDRPDFQAAVALVEAGRVKNFVVKDMSRFGRDYLKVGFYTEVMFPDMEVRFVALYDNVDSSAGENDLTPFRNIMNEWYARDTSKKVRGVFHAKGMSGEPLAANAVYGYRKNPNDSSRRIVDEEAAAVVQQIFRDCLAGLGVTHIAAKLSEAQVEIPKYYAARTGAVRLKELPDDPYTWSSTTVNKILSRVEYIGHTVNFKTYRKSYKNKRKLEHDPSEYVIFENTHEAIIDRETFERVQQLRATGKRRRNNSGRLCLFSGITFCAGCGSRMYLSSGACLKLEQDNFVCSGFRRKTTDCGHSHFIRVVVLEEMLLARIQQVTAFANGHEREFVEMLTQDGADKTRKELAASKRNLVLSERRIAELDHIIQKLYEDKVAGVLTEERFIKLSRGYEQEQRDLQTQTEALARQIAEQEPQKHDPSRFLAQVRKYTHVTELTPTLLNELVERIEIHAPDKSSGKRIQKIDVVFNYVGIIEKLGLPKSNASAVLAECSKVGQVGSNSGFSKIAQPIPVMAIG